MRNPASKSKILSHLFIMSRFRTKTNLPIESITYREQRKREPCVFYKQVRDFTL